MECGLTEFIDKLTEKLNDDEELSKADKKEVEKFISELNELIPKKVVSKRSKKSMLEFNKLPEYAEGQQTMTYAGVGSRQTPKKVLDLMTKASAWLARKGYKLQTGTTFKGKEEGADKAFSDGTTNKELFGPDDVKVGDRRWVIAKEVHPNFDLLISKWNGDPNSSYGTGGAKLMARNAQQVFGKNLDTPVDFVLAWTPLNGNGEVVTHADQRYYGGYKHPNNTGGTGQAIALASLKGIPVINMADVNWRKQLTAAINKAKNKRSNKNNETRENSKLGIKQYQLTMDLSSVQTRVGQLIDTQGKTWWGKDVAWFGPTEYAYSGKKHQQVDMPPYLEKLANRIEVLTKAPKGYYNSVLMNRFPEGKGIAAHSDDEVELKLKDNAVGSIAVMTLGGSADIKIHPKGEVSKTLETITAKNGSVYVMPAGQFQNDYLHSVGKADSERYSITFRHMPTVEIQKTIKFKDKITRKDLQNNPNTQYIFGDNLLQKGLGGQAKEMRGESNAIGIPTKKKPSTSKDAYFTDAEYEDNIKAIDEAISKIDLNKSIVVPTDGIGTGLAALSKKAPKTWNYLAGKMNEIVGKEWLKPVEIKSDTTDTKIPKIC